MPGHSFHPRIQDEYFAGIVFVSSLQHKYYDIFLNFIRRYSAQIREICKKRGITCGDYMSALGRTYNGHTALIVGKNRKIEKIVGWDPLDATKAFMESTLKGYSAMEPIDGSWHDDIGMDGDPTAVYYGLKINEKQYGEFKDFISILVGREDFGPYMADIGINFKYAFAPADWMGKISSLENKKLELDKIDIVSNCGDAAFHVFATFLYDWRKPQYVATLKTFVDQCSASHKNFSQGKLMQWANIMQAKL